MRQFSLRRVKVGYKQIERDTINSMVGRVRERGERESDRESKTYTWRGSNILLFHKRRRGATLLLMSNKKPKIHHSGAGGHLSSQQRRIRGPVGRHQETTIINGFTILEISRVHSSRIHRGVKTKTLSRRVHDRLWWSLFVNHRQSDFLLDFAGRPSFFPSGRLDARLKKFHFQRVSEDVDVAKKRSRRSSRRRRRGRGRRYSYQRAKTRPPGYSRTRLILLSDVVRERRRAIPGKLAYTYSPWISGFRGYPQSLCSHYLIHGENSILRRTKRLDFDANAIL